MFYKAEMVLLKSVSDECQCCPAVNKHTQGTYLHVHACPLPNTTLPDLLQFVFLE